MRIAWVTVAEPCLDREALRRLLLDLLRDTVGDCNKAVVSSMSGRPADTSRGIIASGTSSSSSFSSSSSSKSSPAYSKDVRVSTQTSYQKWGTHKVAEQQQEVNKVV
jgi:hypothetical protein